MTTTTEPGTVLDPEALYFGDNGRVFCGSLRCAGTSAAFSGREISGQEVVKIYEAQARAFEAELADLGALCACEGCGMRHSGLVNDEGSN